MRIIQAPRASTILYRLLVGQKQKKLWLLPANICPIVPITFLKARVPFQFVDISATTLNMDLEQAEAWIKKQEVGGLLYAHTYGESSTPDDFFRFARSLNPEMLIVDDRCLCVPEFSVSSFADVVLYSTGYAKVVDLGFGGYAFIDETVGYQLTSLPFNPAHYAEIERLYKAAIQSGTRFFYNDSDWLETDSVLPKWDEYHQQVENVLPKSLARRETLNKIYRSRLPEEMCLPQPYQAWRFNIRVANKKEIMKAVIEDGLFASSHYASLAGIMSDGDAPVAETLASEVINLFNDHYFDEPMAERICEIILNRKN